MNEDKLLHGFHLLVDYQNEVISNSEILLELAKSLHEFIRNSKYRPAYDGSLLDIIGGVSKPITSQILANILMYKDENNHSVLLESFVKNFINKDIEVENPIITAEKEHIDVAVRDKQYAIVIENKLKDAVFQRNQLARYIAHMKEHNYNENNIFIIIMPQFYDTIIRLSAGRLPEDWRKSNGSRKCVVKEHECWCDYNQHLDKNNMEWCSRCDKTIFNRLRANTVTLHDNFAEWLIAESETLPTNQWPLRSCMLQFAYYLKGLYYTRFNSKLNMAITDFLREKILTKCSAAENWRAIDETINELDQLKSSISDLKGQVALDYITEWQNTLSKQYPHICTDYKNGVSSFGLEVNGVWIGCWSGTNGDNGNKPYWGFYSREQPTDEQVEMVKSILASCDITNAGEVRKDQGFMQWVNTLHGDERCLKFYRAAKDLGYLQ